MRPRPGPGAGVRRRHGRIPQVVTRDGGLIAGVQARIGRAMDVAIGRESDRLTRGLTVLASVGATAPFIGLFGTVWGIKHAFEQIALQQNTNLAVVAPGIAEALVATALGLLAAIPAVIFYNAVGRGGPDRRGIRGVSPTNSPPSCRASWTACAMAGACIERAAGGQAARAPRGGRARCPKSTSRPLST
jgi:hypothetical protein